MGDGEFIGGQAIGSKGDILRFLASQLVAEAGISQPKVVARNTLQAHLLDGRHLDVACRRLELERRSSVLENVENIPGWETVDPSLGILKVQFVAELARLTKVAQMLELPAAIGELLQWNVIALSFAGLEHRRLERLVELKIERQAGTLDGGETACVVDDFILAAGELGIIEPGLRRLELRVLEHSHSIQVTLLPARHHTVHSVGLHIGQAVAVRGVVEALHHCHPAWVSARFRYDQLHIGLIAGELGRDN